LGKPVLAGSAKLLEQEGVGLPDAVRADAETHRAKGCTITFVAVDGVLAATWRFPTPASGKRRHDPAAFGSAGAAGASDRRS